MALLLFRALLLQYNCNRYLRNERSHIWFDYFCCRLWHDTTIQFFQGKSREFLLIYRVITISASILPKPVWENAGPREKRSGLRRHTRTSMSSCVALPMNKRNTESSKQITKLSDFVPNSGDSTAKQLIDSSCPQCLIAKNVVQINSHSIRV